MSSIKDEVIVALRKLIAKETVAYIQGGLTDTQLLQSPEALPAPRVL